MVAEVPSWHEITVTPASASRKAVQLVPAGP
jgi:hypothetical protein